MKEIKRTLLCASFSIALIAFESAIADAGDQSPDDADCKMILLGNSAIELVLLNRARERTTDRKIADILDSLIVNQLTVVTLDKESWRHDEKLNRIMGRAIENTAKEWRRQPPADFVPDVVINNLEALCECRVAADAPNTAGSEK